MIELLAALLVAAIALPHLLPLERAAPAVAASAWTAALALRALTVLNVAVYLVLYLPHTELFAALTHWCWETVLPLLTAHFGLDGSRFGIGAVVLAAAVLAASLTSVAWGVLRATRSLRTSVLRGSLARGPSESLIVGGSTVILAAAGIARPRVIVSAGALTALDDEELAAGLEHERGHIARRHRYVMVFAELSRGLARFLPGTRRAVQELRYHLERDADRWAVAHRHDPYALAAAICKATMPRSARDPWVASLGGGDATRRVDELLGNGKGQPGPIVTRGLQAVAVLLCCLAIILLVSVPSTALAGMQQVGQPAHRHCEH